MPRSQPSVAVGSLSIHRISALIEQQQPVGEYSRSSYTFGYIPREEQSMNSTAHTICNLVQYASRLKKIDLRGSQREIHNLLFWYQQRASYITWYVLPNTRAPAHRQTLAALDSRITPGEPARISLLRLPAAASCSSTRERAP